MIASLIIWIYTGALAYLYGASALRLLGRWFGRAKSDDIGLPLTLVFGLSLLTTLATFLSLAIPLGVTAAAVLLVAGLLLGLGAKVPLARNLRWPKGSEWWLIAILSLAVLFCLVGGTGAPTNPDTNAYHAQTIRWIENYRAVPGLGNLNGRLAYNSSWLLLNAAFSASFLGLRSFHVMAGLLFLITALHFTKGVQGLMHGGFSVANMMRLIFLPAAFWILKGELSSPGTDLPAILLTWVLISSAVEYEAQGTHQPIHAVVLAVLTALMVVIKLSTAPLVLISFYVLARSVMRRDARTAATVFLAIVLILAPWMMRSVVLSGYPVFPYPQLSLFHVDWRMPAADVDAVRNGILGWARLPSKNWGEALALPVWAWIPEWIAQRTLNQQLVLALALAAPLGLLPRGSRKYALPILTAYTAMLVWFLGAPNWRFGYGVVLGMAAFSISVFLVEVASRLSDRLRGVFAVSVPVLLAGLLAAVVVASVDDISIRDRILLPVDYYPSRATGCRLGSMPMYCASLNRPCSYSAFPCVPGIPQSVRARGTELQDGFYSTELEQRP